LVLPALDGVHSTNEGPLPKPISVNSPDGRLTMDVFLDPAEQAVSAPHYRVSFDGRPIVEKSALRVDLADGSTLGSDCMIDNSETRAIRSEFRQHPGKRSKVVAECVEATITLRERGPRARKWQLVCRAYDDGVAFRYRFPSQEGWPPRVLAGERTTFLVPAGASAFTLPLKSFTTSYETRCHKKPVAEVLGDWLLGLPLLVELPGTGWAAIAEANLTDYAGMYLARQGNGTALISRLAPLPREPGVAVRSSLPHNSPWRVVMVADRVGRLVESDLLLNLNDPCAVEDVSWIKPGKTTFPWWNGFV